MAYTLLLLLLLLVQLLLIQLLLLLLVELLLVVLRLLKIRLLLLLLPRWLPARCHCCYWPIHTLRQRSSFPLQQQLLA